MLKNENSMVVKNFSDLIKITGNFGYRCFFTEEYMYRIESSLEGFSLGRRSPALTAV